jgi:hypothetical protein
MMNEIACGKLYKMAAEVTSPIDYYLRLGDQKIALSAYLGKEIHLEYVNEINCIQCNRKTKKSFHQGYCYPCMLRLAECNYCIIHPERCCSKDKPCPQDDWAHEHCNQSHMVYLANSSGLKVGITREQRLETRWIDQGACQAIPLFQVGNRYQSGMIESCLKRFVNDRTDWRKLLRYDSASLHLISLRDELLSQADTELSSLIAQFNVGCINFLKHPQAVALSYPVLNYPDKLKTLSFDKAVRIGGQLQGIKGQYLIFDTGVINVRKFSGYVIKLLTKQRNL